VFCSVLKGLERCLGDAAMGGYFNEIAHVLQCCSTDKDHLSLTRGRLMTWPRQIGLAIYERRSDFPNPIVRGPGGASESAYSQPPSNSAYSI
jgi:hypothetical protein